MILSWFHLPLLLLVSLLFLHIIIIVVVVVVVVVIIIVIVVIIIIIIIIIIMYNGYRVFPEGKVRLGRAADPSPPSSAAVMEE